MLRLDDLEVGDSIKDLPGYKIKKGLYVMKYRTSLRTLLKKEYFNLEYLWLTFKFFLKSIDLKKKNRIVVFELPIQFNADSLFLGAVARIDGVIDRFDQKTNSNTYIITLVKP
ncbi:MAG: hypothetical protein KatS3mg002_0274 [Candidatus Woesearchaeota archaeon]|nr:MAG: hypothetical protein KatS3mg002_0274 [Candidatus Woesearchaeota archaeon]